MNPHMPIVSFGGQSNSDAQPIATKNQAELYCAKYCSKHHKNLGARCALYDIVDNMQLKDEAASNKFGDSADSSRLGGQLHKAFMAEIGEEMCQAEVAHYANGIPEFFVSRQVKNIALYRKLLALNDPAKESERWWGNKFHGNSDLELYECREQLWFECGSDPSPYLPWQETPEAQVASASLYDYFRFVQYHGGREPYLSWRDPSGAEPSLLPIVCMQPAARLKENDNFARNARWALLQYHDWSNRLTTFFFEADSNGDPKEPERVKNFFREWVLDDSSTCPWYVREQYFNDNRTS